MAATRDATRDATWDATMAATWDATMAATRAATMDATWAAKLSPLAQFLLHCAHECEGMWDGGNQWSAYVAYLSFFRHIAKLDLPEYEKFAHYEDSAIHGGPRIMHSEFCMVSDRPEFIHMNGQNQPHQTSGPFTQWRDGFAIYALNGIVVPRWIVETSAEELDPKEILKIANVDQRREAIRKAGAERMIQKLGAKSIECRGEYELLSVDWTGSQRIYLKMRHPSIGVWHVEAVAPECRTIQQAINWRAGGRNWTPAQLT
jgi:RNA-binding protein YhbY